MKYAVFADIHGNYRALEKFFLETSGCDIYFCLGDIVHDGKSFDENRCIDLIRTKKAIVVRGNHDAEVIAKEGRKILKHNLEYLASLPEEIVEGNCKLNHAPSHRTVLTLDVVMRIFKSLEQGVNLYFFGHTHKPTVYSKNRKNKVWEDSLERGKIFVRDGHKYIINPGTLGVGQGKKGTYLVFNEKKRELEFRTLSC